METVDDFIARKLAKIKAGRDFAEFAGGKYKIEAGTLLRESDDPKKVIILERLPGREPGAMCRYRIGYYMLDVSRGGWMRSQANPVLNASDLRMLYAKAHVEGTLL